MEYRVFQEDIALRLDVGDEVTACIEEVCRLENIQLGTVSGLGAVSHAVLGLYQVSSKTYLENSLNGDMEMVSLTGNITRKDGQPYLHLHASFGDASARTFGGHLKKAVISVTGEIWIHRVSGWIGRKTDPATGLNIMDFGD